MIAQVCPVCHGTAHVPLGFYDYGPLPPGSTTIPMWEPCRSCANGIVYVSGDATAVPYRWPFPTSSDPQPGGAAEEKAWLLAEPSWPGSQ